MNDKLKDEILTLCTGYDATYVSKILAELQCDVVSKHVVRTPDILICPRCGKPGAYVTDVYNGVGPTKHKVAMMVFCHTCKFHGPKIMRSDLPNPYNIAAWRWKAIMAWNNISTCNLFDVLDSTFGKKYQMSLFREETAELISALLNMSIAESRLQRGDRDVSTDDVVAEMADTIICIYQWMYSNDIDFGNIDTKIQEKLNKVCQHESVRSAIAKLSKRITERTTITSVHTAEESS